MIEMNAKEFNVEWFLANAGIGRRVIRLEPKETLFSQGDDANCVFYIQKGRVKNTVVSTTGKEATLAQVEGGDFIGEESLAAPGIMRLSTATALTTSTVLKITREEILRVIHEEHDFSELFLKFMLKRSMRMQADLVDQLFNSSEKRLARILLMMAEFGQESGVDTLIPKISQENLAQMVGTTRSRVSFFMNRFRKLGFIQYSGRIRVHKSLLNVVLHDYAPNVHDRNKKPQVATRKSRSK